MQRKCNVNSTAKKKLILFAPKFVCVHNTVYIQSYIQEYKYNELN